MRAIILFCFIVLIAHSGNGQATFIAKGKIEFERKINIQRQFDETESDGFFADFISKLPKFHTSYFDLYFNEAKTVYRPGREVNNGNMPMWGLGPAKENVIVTDLQKQAASSQKVVFEDTYLITDSLKKLQWKMEPETRVIAGFECRKAVARICDTVYVVAFYTDEITVSGGPESFHGLPGMILGLAVPRLYTTWFATKVELVEPKPNQLAGPSKGKKVTLKDLEATLQKSLKDWGKMGQRNIWWVML